MSVPMNVIIREWVIGATMIVIIGLMVVFAAYVIPHLRDWRKEFWVRVTAYLMVFCFGLVIRWAWIWFLLWNFEKHGSDNWIGEYWPIDVVGGVLTTASGLGLIYSFSPDNWGHKPWLITAAAMTAFVAAVHLPW
jgi:hypothetical protein